MALLMLDVLGHSCAADALRDDAAVAATVAWLEDTKVRALPPDTRAPLRDVTSPGWGAAFTQYLAATGCPLPPNPRLPALLWLLSQAVALEYRDAAGADGGGHGAGDEKDGDDGVELSGVKDSPQLWRSVSLAAATLGVRHPGQGVSLPGAGDGAAQGGAHSDADPVVTADALAGAAQRLAWLAGVAPDERARVAAAAAEAADIPDAFPLGFELADKALGRPAALLRARHVAELRALQSRVDAALVAAQECTADPRTDTRLGRVGR